ncbi:hypothetical protein BGI33_07805 [Snodgrassella alvi]|uniref:Uncharacterized protein n=1 Tax=Snodgrassella alvi TaxID=1196083 RepID=A0A2N9WWS5_9NEIS|nr:hypothetical protein BGI33_07805 [Snodgrassella alvi]PIT17890.1 hypothetical protein BGI34_06425 [Snodgrassella alvi]PIT18883.1 hypothetical protein BGI32_00610 [Snodgrassella alvi]
MIISGYDSGWRNQPTLSQATHATFVYYFLAVIAEICTLAAGYITLTVICMAAGTGGSHIGDRVYTQSVAAFISVARCCHHNW